METNLNRLMLTSDVVGVVKAVPVEFAWLCLFSRWTLLLFSWLSERVSTPLPGAVLTTWLKSRGKGSDCFT